MSPDLEQLFGEFADALAQIETRDEALGFCQEFLSIPEIERFAGRWRVFSSVMEGHSVTETKDECGVSRYWAGRARKQLGQNATISSLLFERCYPGKKVRINRGNIKEGEHAERKLDSPADVQNEDRAT